MDEGKLVLVLLTYLQRLIPLTMIYYSTAYSMFLVFKALCYLGLDLTSLKDSKLFQFEALILTQLSCVVVYLSALFLDPFFLFFIHNLLLVLFSSETSSISHAVC